MRVSRSRLAAILVLPLTGLVAACTPTLSLQTVPPPTQSKATISAQPSGSQKVAPSTPIVVTADSGQLASVQVSGPKGEVPGQLSPDGRTWTADATQLGFGKTYTVAATAVDSRGVETTTTSEFSTVDPSKFVHAEVVSPQAGSTMGVGTPIVVKFDRNIKRKAEVEKALVVTTPTPLVGAWAWRDDSTVEFRPMYYWPGNIPVTVDLNLDGVQTGKETFGKGTTQFSFNLGPSMVTHVDAEKHKAQVYRDGEKVKTIPITTGKDGFETRSGTLVITTKERTRIMDAATGGTDTSDPEYYRLKVEYAMRITNSGEFLHAAPWSVGSQGRANVSHGCVGMSTSDAQWLFDNSSLGDVVEITGTSVPQNLGNGITVWTESWDDWLARSENGAVVTTVAATAVPTAESSAEPSSSASAPGDASPEPSASPVAFQP